VAVCIFGDDPFQGSFEPDGGGLLLAVPPENEQALLEALRARGTPFAVTIGRLTGENPGRLSVLSRGPVDGGTT